MNNDQANKRQRLDSEVVSLQQDQTDFLGFDYTFHNSVMPQQQSLPEDLFMFVSDTIPASDSITMPTPPIVAMPQPADQSVYTLIVGGQTFRLSWESLKSDGPTNFFIEYFLKHKTKIMYIDRDPTIFELVVRHLRGYYVRPVDDVQNRSLLYDANYYGLNRLIKILHEFLYINVGGRVFCIPWSLFEKDEKPNFFTGPLMHSVLLPQLEDKTTPPIYIDRDPDIFSDIVDHLRGYTIHIRDEMHRKNLLRDAQYYVFRQLSDKLLTAQQTVAGFGECNNPELLLLLQDVRVVNILPSKAMENEKLYSLLDLHTPEDWRMIQIQYKRAVEGPPHALLMQIGDLFLDIHQQKESIKLMYEMNEQDMKKMNNIAHVAKASAGVNLELYMDDFCAISIDDQQVPSVLYCIQNNTIETHWEPCTQCHVECQTSRLILQRAICGVYLFDNRIALNALRLEAISSRYRLNLKREFLTG